jgi:hypothetical protein
MTLLDAEATGMACIGSPFASRGQQAQRVLLVEE